MENDELSMNDNFQMPLEMRHMCLSAIPHFEREWIESGCDDEEYPTHRSYIASHPDVFDKLSSSACRILYEKYDLLQEGKIVEDEYLCWFTSIMLVPEHQDIMDKRGFFDCKPIFCDDGSAYIQATPVFFGQNKIASEMT